MVRLKNIEIIDGIAEADYYPEDSKESGHIVVDTATREYLYYEEVADFGAGYPAHARKCLIEMAKAGESGKERLVMWY